MSLIKCPECNKEVSDKAKICPHCGYRMNYEKTMNIPFQVPIIMSVIYIIFIVASFGYIIYGHDIVLAVVGILLCSILIVSYLVKNPLLDKIFFALYVMGAIVLIFDYNITQLNFEGSILGKYTYNGSVGVFLLVFQLVSLATIALFIVSQFVKNISPKIIFALMLICGIVGMIFSLYNRQYKMMNSLVALPLRFYNDDIWKSLAVFAFFLLGATFSNCKISSK